MKNVNFLESVIFDLDGTLIDSYKSIVASIKKILEKAGYTSSINLRELIGPPIEEIFELILPQSNEEIINNLIATYRKEYDSEGWKSSRLYNEVPSVLKNLIYTEKCDCYIITNKPKLPTQKILKHFDIKRFFRDTISPDMFPQCHISKSEMLSSLIQKHRIYINNSILVGDSEEDAKAAFENKVSFIAVSYGYGKAHLQNTYPKYKIVKNISEILT